MTTTTTRTTAPAASGHRALHVVGAAVAGLVVWLLAVPVLGVELAARSGGGTLVVGPASVAVAGLLAGLAGWGLLALLERRTGRARRTWTAIATGALVLSLLGPLAQGASAAAVLTLAAMHVAVGTALIVLLGRTSPTRPTARD